MSTSAMAWMATAMSMPQLLEDGKLEQSKQASKALKCVAFTNMQVGSLMGRRRDRLERRIKAVAAEIRLLEADMLENMSNRDLRRAQMDDIEDDLDQAHALGNAQLEEELAEELQVLRDEDTREAALFRSLKRAVHSRRRVRDEFVEEKRAVEEATAELNVKQNLIQTLLSSCAKREPSNCNTASSSASESECGSSEHSESSLDQDLEMASSRRAAGPRPMRSSLRLSSASSDTDSQASSQASKRTRTVSFSPLPPTEWAAPEIEASDDERFPRRQYPHRLQVRVYAHHEQGEEISDSDDSDDERESSSTSASEEDEDQRRRSAAAEPAVGSPRANVSVSPPAAAAAAIAKVSVEETASVE